MTNGKKLWHHAQKKKKHVHFGDTIQSTITVNTENGMQM